MGNPKLEAERQRVGLCFHCRHMRRIVSERGSTFYLCQKSANDASFPKYPKLPVEQCSGHENLEPEQEKER